MANFTQAKMKLDSQLKSQNKESTNSSTIVTETHYAAELKELTSHVNEQAQMIQNLKVQLFLLKRKDTPAVSMPTLVIPTTTKFPLQTNSSTKKLKKTKSEVPNMLESQTLLLPEIIGRSSNSNFQNY